MTRLLVLVGAVGTGLMTGCGPKVGTRPEPIDVTASVTRADGKPLPADLAVVLQPTGDTMPSRLVAKKTGETFTGKAMPGKYMYYIATAKGDTTPKGVPEKCTSPSLENTIEVASGQQLEIKVPN